jgi:small subunit ribosomal protein S1
MMLPEELEQDLSSSEEEKEKKDKGGETGKAKATGTKARTSTAGKKTADEKKPAAKAAREKKPAKEKEPAQAAEKPAGEKEPAPDEKPAEKKSPSKADQAKAQKPDQPEAEEALPAEPEKTATAAEEAPAQKETAVESEDQQDQAATAMAVYDDDEGYSQEEYDRMLAAYDETLKDIREGEIVSGKVIQVTESDIMVDVGFKSEGVIPIVEFGEPLNIKVGDEVDVFLESMENQEGQLVLSKQKADFMKVWDTIKESYENGNLVEGRLQRRIKGGMVVDLFGVDAFLPGSQVALRPVPDLDKLIGEIYSFKIIKLNKMRRNIVISRRVVLEEKRAKAKAKIIKELEVGQIREGTVKNITDFGAFIDLGGIDGLLHITDMSWGRVSHPSELVAIGDVLKVKVLNFDRERERISLGLKQLTPYPWENVEEKYPVGNKVRGKVVSITDYGAFVELEKGIEGLIHISEMSWTQHIRHPSKVVAIGDVVEVMVLKVDKEGEKISLGLKQIQPDPWLTLEERHPVGSRVVGKIRNLTNFGAFVEIEEGIDGLVHISDLSWTRRIHHPSEVLKKGDKAEVVILNVDKQNRRVSLGYKQLIEDPWEHLATVYPVGTTVEGKILRLLERGVIVELPEDVEGFVPLTQLGRTDIHKPAEAFSVGEKIPLKVIEFDLSNRKIILSAKAYFEDREKAELQDYLDKHPVKKLTMGDVAGAAAVDKGASEKKAGGKESASKDKSKEEPETSDAGKEEDEQSGSKDSSESEEDKTAESSDQSEPSDEKSPEEADQSKASAEETADRKDKPAGSDEEETSGEKDDSSSDTEETAGSKEEEKEGEEDEEEEKRKKSSEESQPEAQSSKEPDSKQEDSES